MTLKMYIDLFLQKIEFYITQRFYYIKPLPPQQKTTHFEKWAMELNKHFCRDK